MPANGNPVLQPHQLSQHFGPLDDRDLPLPRLHHFGVLLIDRGTGYHYPGADYIARGVSLKNGGAQAGQAVRDTGSAQVGSGDGVPQGQQDLRDAAHPNATNANEMNALRLGKQGWRSKMGGVHPT